MIREMTVGLDSSRNVAKFEIIILFFFSGREDRYIREKIWMVKI